MDKETELYKKLVYSGEFYNYLDEKFKKNGIMFNSRKDLKVEVLLILNSENSKKRERKSKRIFRELFPNVYNIFTEFKKENYKVFPILLLCLESHLFLDIICKRISIEHPNLVNYPVHDCIITTKGSEQIVDVIMKDEIKKVFGIEPNLKHEDLNKENAFKELEKLRLKAKII